MGTTSGSAVWQGGIKDGKGSVSTKSGALDNAGYGFGSRFEGKAGTNPEELIGVVRFDRDEPNGREAEYAAVITDRWHGQGIGMGMTCLLVNAAIERGVTLIYAIVQPDNWRMITLFRNLGLPETITYVDDVERIEVEIGRSTFGVCRPTG